MSQLVQHIFEHNLVVMIVMSWCTCIVLERAVLWFHHAGNLVKRTTSKPVHLEVHCSCVYYLLQNHLYLGCSVKPHHISPGVFIFTGNKGQCWIQCSNILSQIWHYHWSARFPISATNQISAMRFFSLLAVMNKCSNHFDIYDNKHIYSIYKSSTWGILDFFI